MDALDIWIADPLALPELQPVVAEFAWGAADVREHSWRGWPLGRVIDPSSINPPRSAPPEVVARLRAGAVICAADNSDLGRVVAAIEEILQRQQTWMIHCEVEFDTQKLPSRAMTIAEAVTAIEDTLTHRSMGFIGWSRRNDERLSDTVRQP